MANFFPPMCTQGGTCVREIRESTGAKVRMDESVPGVPERAIVIYSSDR